MNIDNINLNHLRIFESVFRSKSMTTAARELHLTQPGVSQHMKALEEGLGIRLFDRVKQRLVPTSAATELFNTCVQGLAGIERTITELKGGDHRLAGTVSIGMPIEFGNNIVLPLLAEFCKKHPAVRVALRYGFATEMSEAVLSGALDFAFVDEFSMDKRIFVDKVYDETLYLCASQAMMAGMKKAGAVRNTRDYFETLEYIDYQAGEPLLRMWFRHHLKARELRLNVRATVMDVQGVARLITSGLAAGVLPGHLVEKLDSAGHRMHTFKGCGKPLKNSISVCYLEERSFSPAARAALDELVKKTRGEA